MNEKYNVYDLLGPERLKEVVDLFYGHVSAHPDLKPIFPDDMTETKRKQKQFLTQFFGGPPLYTEEHGHPMLRARHMPFVITPARADAWLSCMAQALTEAEIEEPLRSAMFERLSYTARHMVNHSNNAARGDQN